MARKPITCCPECGSTDGIYTQVTTTRISQHNYSFDGYHQLSKDRVTEKTKETRVMRCQVCDATVSHARLMRKQWGEGLFRLYDSKTEEVADHA